MTALRTIDAQTVTRNLHYPALIPAVRAAMIALSTGKVDQLLRSLIPVKARHIFALMPAANHASGYFGVKMISVFPDAAGVMQHAGYIMLFREKSGEALCLVDAEEVTRLRTAAATAVATDVLAAPDAGVLAVLGCGKQAAAHIEAISQVRLLRQIRIWGRDPDKAEALAATVRKNLALSADAACDVASAVRDADIVCTVTGAIDPILKGAWVKPGALVNTVGSSTPNAAEIDGELVTKSRFIADHRAHVLAHGGEFLRAKKAGTIADDHVVAEIGEVLAGLKPARVEADQTVVYKSLGHAVQDLAAAAWLYENI